MAVACSSCGTDNPDISKFCAECGAPLASSATPPRKERKFATALFADLVGSTTLGEQEDPEVVQAVVGAAFDRLATEVQRYGGLLEKFMGDALLAVFGVPQTHEDDPERAVRCGLEMLAILSELNRGFRSEFKPELKMRIGIEAGEVLVDLERAAGPRDRMLTGDAVNTAARLQAAADPDTLVVGPAVYAATHNVIDYEEQPPQELKGKAALVQVWRALRVRARVGGERAPLGLEAALVGRDEEMELLKQTLNRVESEGRPALATILGPAGVGKSRLVRELSTYVDSLSQVVYWRRGRCPPYGATPYSALAETIKAQCEIHDDDPAEEVEKKVRRVCEELFGDDTSVAEISTLVGATTSGERFSKEQLFDAWRRFFERLAARYPLVLVLEDIHWADDGLLDFVDHIADWGTGPIFVLTLARPELLDMRPGWGGGKRNYSALYLDPLSEEESGAMLTDLLHGALPPELMQLLIDRSEGMPLFTEELVRMFIDKGFLVGSAQEGWTLRGSIDSIDVPHSIQNLIAARLDGLPAEEKALLQDAAVIGRIFWEGAAMELSGRPKGEVGGMLGRLRLKDIVTLHEPPTFSDDIEFAFRHSLIRDVAYESLPKALRAGKHVDVARWAERRAGDRAEEFAQLLATHYEESLRYRRELGDADGDLSDLLARGLHWARAAGDRARALWQANEAVRWYRTALQLADHVELDELDMAELWERYGKATIAPGPVEEVTRAALEALKRFDALGRDMEAGEMESLLGQTAFQGGRDEDVRPWLDKALTRLEPLGPSPSLADALHALAWYLWRRGKLEEAAPLARRAVEVADSVDSQVLKGQALQTLAGTIIDAGRWAEGLEMLEESHGIAERAGDLPLLLRSTNNLPANLIECGGEMERAERVLREGLELVRRAGGHAESGWLLGTLGDLMTDLGRLDEAVELQTAAIEVARGTGERPLLGHRLNEMSHAKMLRGDVDEAENIFSEAKAILTGNPEPQSELVLARNEAALLEAGGDREGALARLLTAIDELFGFGRGFEVLVTNAVVMLARMGRREEGRTLCERLQVQSWNEIPRPAAYLKWVMGVTADDPHKAVELLTQAREALNGFGVRIVEGRCLLDLADATERAGEDPLPILKQARTIFEDCGARLWLEETETRLAVVDAER